jgi:O-antigen/teichoic acid export membrane protein
MPDEARRRDQLIGVFLVGIVLFDPPLLHLFSGPSPFGWPLLYIYVFAAWAAVIAAVALIAERRHRPEEPRSED